MNHASHDHQDPMRPKDASNEGLSITSTRELIVVPSNEQHFRRLVSFLREILSVCHELAITPILTSSLAVLVYTRNPAIEVHDVDLACSEADFARLRTALEARGIVCFLKPWHVLQAIRDDLKVDFDAAEYWMRDLQYPYRRASIAGMHVAIVDPEDLRTLYRRGLTSTSDAGDSSDPMKHAAIEVKVHALANIAE